MNDPQINNQNEAHASFSSPEVSRDTRRRMLGRTIVGVTLGVIGAKSGIEITQALLDTPADTYFFNIVMPVTVGIATGAASNV